MVLKRLLRYLKPYKVRFSVAFIVLLIATGAELAVVPLVSRYLDHELIPDRFDPHGLLRFGAVLMGLELTAATLRYWQNLTFQVIALDVVREMRREVFARVQRLALSFFDRVADGSLVSRITNDTEAVKDLFIYVVSSFLQNIVFIFGVVVAMFVLDPVLASWMLLFLPVMGGLMHFYRVFSGRVYRVIRSKLAEINARINESIQGMNIIQALVQEKRLRREFAEMNEEHYRAVMRNIRLFALMLRPANHVLSMVAIVFIINRFGLESLEGPVSIGVMYGFVNLVGRMFEPANQIMMRLSQMQQSVVSAERVFELIDNTEFAPDKTGAGTPEITEGRIEFDNVSFSYDGKTDVLKNISFTVEPGQTVALVGHTGSGKSSIVNLLMRFYRPGKGEIRIDGHPLDHFENAELRRKMGLVLQDPFLFHGSVKSNIRMHNEDITDEQVREAARFVQADEFISRLPGGYDEPVAERGATFSSGQRQLISFARTMAIGPKILILDEATASVDTETEESIQEALGKMRKGRTTVAIAHRLSTIQDADLILVLHRGEIVERGTHQELLAKQGLYHKMYLLQTGGSAVSV
ncbi:ABC transporter ATP-binding protein [Staphylospora marina]|uniref:ABC transporter ATP-binding protein n=1 Tax=Staphylospora marina TaxID=2490858 RepID=UPI000F5BC17E|nr:ABC transporter ATP-binding protein [Staphylospora marina]